MKVLRGAGVVVLVVLFLAGVAALASLGGDEDGASRDTTRTTATRPLPPARSARTIRELQPKRILARVEALRGLDLRRPPKFVVRTPTQARRQTEAAEARESGGTTSKTDERTNFQLITLLGLIPPSTDLDELGGRVTSQGTLGYYDGDRNEMTIIAKDRDRLPVGVETTVAHELTHAIDDEHFKIFRRVQRLTRPDADEDAELAFRSVVEGSATEVEEAYRKRYRIPQPPDEGDAAQRKLIRDLPFGLKLQLGFPYAVGQIFVHTLLTQQNGRALLARALSDRPPRSTVEVLDATRWVQRQPVVRTPLRPERALGKGWTELDADSIGASDVIALLAPVEADSGRAALVARTWRGGSYRFLRRGGAAERGCRAPCQRRDAVVASVALTADADARSFATQFGRVLTGHRRARPVGASSWRVGAGAASVAVSGPRVTFAYAPTVRLAEALVERAPGG